MKPEQVRAGRRRVENARWGSLMRRRLGVLLTSGWFCVGLG